MSSGRRSGSTPAASEGRGEGWGRRIGQGLVVVGAAVLLYVGLGIWSGVETLRLTLEDFAAGSALLAMGFVLVGWALRGLRWHYYTARLGAELPLGVNLWAFGASFALTATPGKAGEVVKSVLLYRRFRVPVTETAAALLVERLLDLLAVLLLAVGGLQLLDARLYFGVSAVLVAALMLFVLNERLHRGGLHWLRQVRRLAPAADAFGRLFGHGRNLLAPVPFVGGLLLATMAWSCEGLALHVILAELGVEIGVATSFSIFALASLIGALSMLPGGLGGFEATMLTLLGGLGLERGAAVAATVILRLVTLWLVTLLGALLLGLWWAVLDRRPSTVPAPRG